MRMRVFRNQQKKVMKHGGRCIESAKIPYGRPVSIMFQNFSIMLFSISQFLPTMLIFMLLKYKLC